SGHPFPSLWPWFRSETWAEKPDFLLGHSGKATRNMPATRTDEQPARGDFITPTSHRQCRCDGMLSTLGSSQHVAEGTHYARTRFRVTRRNPRGGQRRAEVLQSYCNCDHLTRRYFCDIGRRICQPRQ